MPSISRFCGITIRMFFNEDFHPGQPHFHARLMAYHRNVLSLPPRLVEAKALSGYEVYLRFADGLAADVALSYLLDFGGVFGPLRDVEFFRELTIDDGGNTVCWPNEADIAPETLYDHVQRAEYEKRRVLSV